MRISTLALLPIMAIVVSCGGSGGGQTESSVPELLSGPAESLPSNADILRKAYDVTYSVPDGFFVDELAETETRSYTVHHVLDDSGNFELCSDDLVEAQALEHADNASRAVNGYLVTVIENDRYFEFVRELSYEQDVGNIDDITSPGYARVFKCEHTNRAGVDRDDVNGYSGIRNAQPMNASALRDFTEYLWQFRFFNARHKLVIDSYSSTDGAKPEHTLLLAFVFSQGTEQCDRVDVVEWKFSANQASGEVSRSFDTVRSFEARLIGGVAEICG